MNKEEKALQLLKEASQGKSLDELAQLTGFRKEKLFQWKRISKLPSAKVVKQLLKSL